MGRPMPKGCMEYDFVGASHSALLDSLRAGWLSDADLRAGLIATIEADGATHNQRQLIHEAIDRAIPRPTLAELADAWLDDMGDGAKQAALWDALGEPGHYLFCRGLRITRLVMPRAFQVA